MSSSRFVLLGALALASCASPPVEGADLDGHVAQAITAGSPDDTESPVVWIVAEVKGARGFCSGVVVSPHVVLTAAHCSTMDATYSIFLGADYNDPAAKALPENHVTVSEHHPHPKYDAARNVNDIGVLVTDAPIPRKPAVINREPLAASDIGQPIRIVGFGQTAGNVKTVGRRHQATTVLSDFDAKSLTVSGAPNICLFDSGGPTFMTRGGVEVVAGIHSIVESASCDMDAWDARVDPYAGFIDDQIAAFDPPVETPSPAPPPAPATEPSATSGCSVADRYDAPRALLGLAALALLGAARRRRAAS